jgi:hypothetical protein
MKCKSENHIGKRPFGVPGHRWEYNIKMDLNNLGWRVQTVFS